MQDGPPRVAHQRPKTGGRKDIQSRYLLGGGRFPCFSAARAETRGHNCPVDVSSSQRRAGHGDGPGLTAGAVTRSEPGRKRKRLGAAPQVASNPRTHSERWPRLGRRATQVKGFRLQICRDKAGKSGDREKAREIRSRLSQ